MRKFTITILILLALGIIGFFGYRAIQTRRQANSISSLQTITVSQGSLTSTVGATGTVRPDQTALLKWSTTGNIDQVSMQVGQMITTGQTLATLVQSSVSQNIILAQSDLINAQRQLDDLQNSHTASRQDIQNLNSSQAAVYTDQHSLVRFDQQAYKEALERAQEGV